MSQDDAIDLVSKSLRRAWQLGQTYWQQADSEFESQHKKADETQRKFDALVDEVRAALVAPVTHLRRNDGTPSGVFVAAPVATVDNCEACFTPDVCRLRGECDHYSAQKLRVAAPVAPAEPIDPRRVIDYGALISHAWSIEGYRQGSGACVAFKNGAEWAVRKYGRAAPVAPAELTRDQIAELVEGMSVSVDISTGEHDLTHRLMGTVTEAMHDEHDKHGLTLLVQDAKPNFTPVATVPRTDAYIRLDVHEFKAIDLLRRVVLNLRLNRRQPFWATVKDATGLGSTCSAELAELCGRDPDTGKEIKVSPTATTKGTA